MVPLANPAWLRDKVGNGLGPMSCHQIRIIFTEICDGLTQACVSNENKNIGQKPDQPSCGQFQPRFALYSSDKKVPRVHLHLCLKPRGGPTTHIVLRATRRSQRWCTFAPPHKTCTVALHKTCAFAPSPHTKLYIHTAENCTSAPPHKTCTFTPHVHSHHHTKLNIHTTQNRTFLLHQFAVLSLLVGWSG